MNCPNCQTGKLKLITDNVVDTECSVLTFWRCETCWTTHNVQFNNPIISSGYSDPLRLAAMSGDNTERYDYYKCGRKGDDGYTLIAKRNYGTKRENIEAMGWDTIEDSVAPLPANRLYELK